MSPEDATATRMRRAWALLKLTLLYAMAEIGYHIHLLRASSDPDLSSADARLLEAVGCTLAAWGMVLLIKRIVKVHAVVAWLLVGVTATGIYWAIDRAIDLVPSLAQEQAENVAKQKAMGIRMRYELALLEGERFNDSYRHRAMLGHAAIIGMRDARQVTLSMAALQSKSATVGEVVTAPLVDDYEAKTSKLLRYCRNACSQQVLAVYNRLTPEQRKQHPIGQRFGRHLANANFQIAGIHVNGFSVPLGLSRSAFTAWIDQRAREQASVWAAKPLSPEQLKQAVRAVWFTPIALTLSLTSVLLNLASVAGLFIMMLTATRTNSRWLLGVVSAATSAAVITVAAVTLLPNLWDDIMSDEGDDSTPVLLSVWEGSRSAELRLTKQIDALMVRFFSPSLSDILRDEARRKLYGHR